MHPDLVDSDKSESSSHCVPWKYFANYPTVSHRLPIRGRTVFNKKDGDPYLRQPPVSEATSSERRRIPYDIWTNIWRRRACILPLPTLRYVRETLQALILQELSPQNITEEMLTSGKTSIVIVDHAVQVIYGFTWLGLVTQWPRSRRRLTACPTPA